MEQSGSSFTEKLASKTPVPGGGAATALVGACAAALLAMVGNYTTGKKKYAEVEEDIRRMLARAEELRLRLLALAEEDAKNFEPLAAAYALPKDAPERESILASACEKACEAPLAMMDCLGEVIDLLAEMREKGSRLLLSDVGCGALFANAALEAAAFNVLVNTKTLSDRWRASEINARVDEIRKTCRPMAEATISGVYTELEN